MSGSPVGARLRRLVALVVVVAGLVLLDGVAMSARVDHVSVDPHPSAGTTWVLVGLDGRADLPAGSDAGSFGTAEQVPGDRADVVVVVHEAPTGATTVLSVPRDVVTVSRGTPTRLALTWLDGPQATLDALCDLGIPSDHLAVIDLAGFAAVVDAAGGLEVDVPAPVRDPAAGLELLGTGTVRVDGEAALALVRSRHPEELVDGAWVPGTIDPDGRAAAAGTVLTSLHAALGRALLRPWRLHAVAWATSGALTVDDGTSAAELRSLVGADLDEVRVLPVGAPVGGSLARFPTEATAEAVAEAGLSCSG